MRKYKLTTSTQEFCGETLHQIIAVKDFGDVKVGDLGDGLKLNKIYHKMAMHGALIMQRYMATQMYLATQKYLTTQIFLQSDLAVLEMATQHSIKTSITKSKLNVVVFVMELKSLKKLLKEHMVITSMQKYTKWRSN